MRELTHSEIESVSGAGVVADFINNIVDAPARGIGSQIGDFAGAVVSQVISGAKGVFEQIFNKIGGLFGR
ncbi:hypothetical protein [Enterobacillus tribolii]|uniref:Uncharacterized protein n=1 Tax=Enterobacillus tribolii TaxID=1487935 RepID=A0A370QEH3_9GAMM|nr:hypothetical protein [Enterobacillus tribolii]MBW7984175.1 hypothetical protein [Enterobacillus tribolii]RDK86764.1 hypothetical protein C8D90_11038 [Enterobacillus tribolii]